VDRLGGKFWTGGLLAWRASVGPHAAAVAVLAIAAVAFHWIGDLTAGVLPKVEAVPHPVSISTHHIWKRSATILASDGLAQFAGAVAEPLQLLAVVSFPTFYATLRARPF